MTLPLCKLRSLGLAILVGLTACSGGDSDKKDDDSDKAPTTKINGLFLDAEVEGLTYTTTSGITGQTDENGTYEFLPGEKISFSVGGVDIGTVDGAPVCTPFDFGAASTNIARFIQSLDADGDPSNGIDIIGASAALAGTTISSDAFLADDATFTANPDIAAALATTGDTLIDAATATANLVAGTDTTFDNAELESKLFIVINPAENDIGIISFDSIADGAEAFSVFANETTAAGEDGLGFDEDWSIDGNGVLTLTDTVDGLVTTVKRVGGSTRSISVIFSEDGADFLPASLLIPVAITADDLGGDGIIGSKTYDVIDSDGSPLNITFNFDGTFTNNTDNETGTFEEDPSPGVIIIENDSFPDELTFLIVIDGGLNVLDQTSNILLLGADIIGGTPDDPILQFNDIGVGSVTLKSSTINDL